MPFEAKATDTVWCEVASNTAFTYTVEHLLHFSPLEIIRGRSPTCWSEEPQRRTPAPSHRGCTASQLGYPSYKDDGIDCVICGNEPWKPFLSKLLNCCKYFFLVTLISFRDLCSNATTNLQMSRSRISLVPAGEAAPLPTLALGEAGDL